MNAPILFTKASGAGNDFIMINDFRGELDVDFAQLAVAACDRHFGVGGDGLLVLGPSVRADFSMHYYNADGSWGGMCGNGGRCIARFAFLEGLAGKHQYFEALGHIYDAEIGENSVRLHMKDPGNFRPALALQVGGHGLQASFMDTGAPHVVVFQDSLESADVTGLGRSIRNHKLFSPEGTNVNFVHRQRGSTIQIRTYERGVEAETLACGTGSVASALASAYRYGLVSPVTVEVRSGEALSIHFKGDSPPWTDVYLDGSAHILFTGSMLFQPAPPRIRLVP